MAAPPLRLHDHPLAGRIWDPAQARFVSAAEAEARVAAADFALLGETHDNARHHEVQARLLAAALARGKRPALVLEQIDTEWQSEVDAARAPGATPQAIALAGRVGRGWDWPLYEPLVALALEHGLPIVAANLARTRAREIASGGLERLGEGEAERLALAASWSEARNAAMRALLVAGHCGQDSERIDGMVQMQRARDAVMADRIGATGARGAFVALGRGHARADLGVPLYLRVRFAERRAISVGLVEVEEARLSPADYREAARGVHDLVWFTPRADRKDPCADFGRDPAK